MAGSDSKGLRVKVADGLDPVYLYGAGVVLGDGSTYAVLVIEIGFVHGFIISTMN